MLLRLQSANTDTSARTDYVLGQRTLKEKVASATFKKNVKAFESSAENAKRSITVFYSSAVMGKRKYKSVRISLSMKTNETTKGRSAISAIPKCPIPKLLPYDKLAKEINQIDIGIVYRFDEEFQRAIGDELTQGCFRKLVEYLPRVAKFYLRKDRKEALQWFGKTEGTFLIAVGGDGYPFGKNESACSFLLSFMNVGKRVASSNDNFIIFGGNCEETPLVVRKYCQFLCKAIFEIENKVFEIEGLHVTFKCAELPNDMKMLAMLGGGLSNSAKYFSSFANVSKDNCTVLKGTFATDRTSLWHPWKYEERIKIANEVKKFKKTLSEKQLKEKQFRSKFTEFIARKKSTQEFVPLIDKLIDHAQVEPLHVKNNAWQYFFKEVLKEALAKSNIADSCKKFSDIPNDSIISRVVTALQFEVKTKCLARKVKNWLDETQKKGKDLQYRFTGKDLRLLCHNFMRLIRWLSGESESEHQRTTLLVLAYLGLRLRDCVSLFSRFEISVEQLTQLSVAACEYYRVNALFLSSVNPAVWTIGHIIPARTKDVHEKYGQGLGIVTMEGREAKHIALKKRSENTLFHRRW